MERFTYDNPNFQESPLSDRPPEPPVDPDTVAPTVRKGAFSEGPATVPAVPNAKRAAGESVPEPDEPPATVAETPGAKRARGDWQQAA